MARGEPLAGGREVEQTLRLARDEVERDIAKYRIGLFAVVVVSTSTLRSFSPNPTWIPTILFGVAVLYAIAIQRAVARFGATQAILYASLLCDLTIGSANFFVIKFVRGEFTPQNAMFAAYIAGPAVLVTILINSLRFSRAASIVVAFVAPTLYFASMNALVGFHPAQIAVAVVLSASGAISLAAAAQARKNLDRFARFQLLRRYLPPAAVERVLRDDPDAATAVGGKLLKVTLLSADLRGFTALAEKLDPKAILEQLNAYHAVMIDVIDRHGGAIDKFIGDGTLVVFGLGGDPATTARAAVACARDMLAALDRHNEERVASGLDPLRMGIGVHTGSVIAGNIGVPGRRLEFTVIGDAVNTASRLEGQTKLAGTPVLVSGETVELLESEAGLRELSAVSMRGKERSVRVFALAT